MKHILIAFWALLSMTGLAAAQGNYLISPGDQLTIEVLEDNTLNRSVLVLPDGSVSFPFAGSVQVAGRTISQVQRAITARIATNFASPPTVFVTVSGLTVPAEELLEADETINVYFTGEVAAPGIKPLLEGTTLLQALAQTGGLTQFAATKRIQLRRMDLHTHKQELYTINYKALSDGAAFARDIVLKDGDVILVPERRLFE
ncbi:MAG: polysaccharide biosynthesis/export family protein [Paracoccaceae bacterium]